MSSVVFCGKMSLDPAHVGKAKMFNLEQAMLERTSETYELDTTRVIITEANALKQALKH